MTGPICKWCGAYLNALEPHDEQACHDEHRRQVYARGATAARQALAAARAAHTPTKETP